MREVPSVNRIVEDIMGPLMGILPSVNFAERGKELDAFVRACMLISISISIRLLYGETISCFCQMSMYDGL